MTERRSRERAGRQPRTPAYIGVVDPGTAMLRVLVVEVRGGQAVVWGWGQVPAVPTAGAESLAMASEEALGRAERMAQERAGHWLMADQMIVGLPAAHLRGRSWSIAQRRSQPERPIEERELAGLLGRGLRLAVNRLADGPQWKLIDTAVSGLAVDGHGVTDPVGFKGRELAAAVFAALASLDQIDAWCLAARRLEFSSVTLTAGPLALAAAVSDPPAVLVDAGGATTDVTFCRSGSPVAVESVPVGGHDLTRALIQRWGLAPERAEYLKWAYTHAELPPEAGPQVKEALVPAVRAWTVETEAALARLSPDEPLPQRLVLLGGASALPELADATRTLAWSESLNFGRHPEVAYLRPTDVPDVVNRTELGRDPGDVTALALAAWAIRQSRPAGRPARLLAELCHETMSD